MPSILRSLGHTKDLETADDLDRSLAQSRESTVKQVYMYTYIYIFKGTNILVYLRAADDLGRSLAQSRESTVKQVYMFIYVYI